MSAELAELPDAAAIELAAAEIEAAAHRLVTRVETMEVTWSGLRSCYEAPERELVLSALDVVREKAEQVPETARVARRALEDFAAVVTGLAARRAALLEEGRRIDSLSTDDETAEGAAQDLADGSARFAADLARADQDCADALGRLAKYDQDLNDWNPGWDAVDPLGLAVGAAGDASTGLAAAMYVRYRGLLVPDAGTDLRPFIDVPQPPAGAVFERGGWWVRSTGGLLVPWHPPMLDIASDPPGFTRTSTVPVGDAVNRPGAVDGLRWGGRTFGVLGAGLAFTSAYADGHAESVQEHTDRTESEHAQAAVAESVVVGGASIAAGLLAGAAVGAAIGSIVPGAGTVVGAVIGGGVVLVAGAIGGFAGEYLGNAVWDGFLEDAVWDGGLNLGEHVSDAVDGIQDVASDVADRGRVLWDSLFG